MDHPWVTVAAGSPVEFENFDVDGQRRCGVPRNGEPFVVAGPVVAGPVVAGPVVAGPVVTSPRGGGPLSPD